MKAITASASLLLVLALAACTPAGSGAEPTEPEPAASQEQQPCEVGFWLLDVADYATQSEQYVLGLGLPVVDFAMSGEGSLDVGADGVITGVVALVSTGTIVAGDTRVPFESPSSYTFSGKWAIGSAPGTLDLSNWATVPDPGVPVDPSVPAAPAIDFTAIPSVSSLCSADSLSLQAPDAPLSATFRRE